MFVFTKEVVPSSISSWITGTDKIRAAAYGEYFTKTAGAKTTVMFNRVLQVSEKKRSLISGWKVWADQYIKEFRNEKTIAKIYSSLTVAGKCACETYSVTLHQTEANEKCLRTPGIVKL